MDPNMTSYLNGQHHFKAATSFYKTSPTTIMMSKLGKTGPLFTTTTTSKPMIWMLRATLQPLNHNTEINQMRITKDNNS
jgi:hypothetical protein